ncbi:hypothetical protein DOTSEDRAFT_20469 [Dothistroma septosporum NZE10]|uniref:Uncharacterized protein n=1 Tax=Dothistroma septosporum (strain NZE10 / CBS 128990) TaxID=675120 RepID=N1Q2V5_DOTSN|nr:hypothetical protein DOTSEDRAFT_20469 [Dothistroma septosporum NZE10]
MAQGGIIAAAIFVRLVLLMVSALIAFTIRRYIHRPAYPRCGYQSLAGDAASSRYPLSGVTHQQFEKGVEANLATANSVINAPVTHAVLLDSPHSCDGVNASFNAPA